MEFREAILAIRPNADVELIGRAYDVAAQCHLGQERRSGDPYINPDDNQLDGLNADSLVPCVSLSYSNNFFGTHFDISIVTAPGDPKSIPT